MGIELGFVRDLQAMYQRSIRAQNESVPGTAFRYTAGHPDSNAIKTRTHCQYENIKTMKKHQFPYVALALAVFLMLLVMAGSRIGPNGNTTLPLLALLVMSEFGFFVTAFGAFFGIQHIRSIGIKSVYTVVTLLCLLFAIRFMWLGIALWPL